MAYGIVSWNFVQAYRRNVSAEIDLALFILYIHLSFASKEQYGTRSSRLALLKRSIQILNWLDQFKLTKCHTEMNIPQFAFIKC